MSREQPNARAPIERYIRRGRPSDGALVVRGSPFSVEQLIRAAERTSTRFSWNGTPLVAVSAVLAASPADLNDALLDTNLRTRRTYRVATVGALRAAGFEVLPTFQAPHVSVVMATLTTNAARELGDALGRETLNPHYARQRGDLRERNDQG